MVPGYTVLVVDTNILLSSLSIFASLVESSRWTILVPLAVVTELDGLSNNPSELGAAVWEALSYVVASDKAKYCLLNNSELTRTVCWISCTDSFHLGPPKGLEV